MRYGLMPSGVRQNTREHLSVPPSGDHQGGTPLVLDLVGCP
jgi:hypothetical protein